MSPLLDSILIALRAIWANKLRSFMTVLGNIVAVTSIITVVSLIQGLNATVVSYMNKMEFGFTVDPDLVPDVHELCEQIHRSFEELQAAAEGVVHRAA